MARKRKSLELGTVLDSSVLDSVSGTATAFEEEGFYSNEDDVEAPIKSAFIDLSSMASV